MNERTAPTFTATIYIAGDPATARQVCREFCQQGLCVTVEPAEFIYTGGAEAGVRVGLLNYPRFPAEPADILGKARALADLLRERLCQHSWLIVTPTETIWNSTRDQSSPPTTEAEHVPHTHGGSGLRIRCGQPRLSRRAVGRMGRRGRKSLGRRRIPCGFS